MLLFRRLRLAEYVIKPELHVLGGFIKALIEIRQGGLVGEVVMLEKPRDALTVDGGREQLGQGRGDGVEQGMLGDTAKYFGENYNIAIGILGYGLLISVTLGLLLFALVSWMPRPVPLVMSWACLFFFLPVLSEILQRVFDDRQWRLLNLWRDIYAVGSRCFGESAVRSRDVAHLSEAAAVIVAVCIFSFIAIVFRIR